MRLAAGLPPVVARLLAAEEALAEAGSELLLLDGGRLVLGPGCPHVYDANCLRRVQLSASLGGDLGARLDRLLVAASRHLAPEGVQHLLVNLAGSEEPERLGRLLRERGFSPERLVVMASTGALGGRRTSGVTLRRVPDEAAWHLFELVMDRMNQEEPWYSPAVSREILASLRSKVEYGALSLFVAVREGRALGSIGLSTHEGVGGLVSVGTLPEERGRGVGSTMVLRAAELARARGDDLVYLIARADDRPKTLYQRLGFEVVYAFDCWLRAPL
jgi:ribosomal protein S18 acetylase RimI-like enzyme